MKFAAFSLIIATFLTTPGQGESVMKPIATKVRITGAGMMDYSAEYELPNDKVTRFEFTFEKNQLDDILSTLRVRGEVTIPEPFSFAAINAEETKLKIDPANPFESLILGMPAKVLIKKGAEQIVAESLGIDRVAVTVGEKVVTQRFLTILDGTGIRRIAFDSIDGYEFADDADKQELRKAVDALHGTTRPGTSLVRFGLQGKGDVAGVTRAVLKWSKPDAAPVMTYRLSITRQNKFVLEGWVIVHNMTNQPWEGTTVEIVSGKPHTFKGNSALAVEPNRPEINVVDAKAEGGRTVVGAAAALAPQKVYSMHARGSRRTGSKS